MKKYFSKHFLKFKKTDQIMVKLMLRPNRWLFSYNSVSWKFYSSYFTAIWQQLHFNYYFSNDTHSIHFYLHLMFGETS